MISGFIIPNKLYELSIIFALLFKQEVKCTSLFVKTSFLISSFSEILIVYIFVTPCIFLNYVQTWTILGNRFPPTSLKTSFNSMECSECKSIVTPVAT